MPILFDYFTLKIIWWLFVGVLLIGFAVMDGFDLGVGALLPFVAKTDDERRVLINSIGPTWEGNQVWFITAGGALFAAWPLVYSAAFSGFYWALLLVLFALFFRPVGFEYRSKVADPRWRSAWDWGLFVGGAVPALVFGVAFGNLLQGVPFTFDDMLRPYYSGNFFGLLNPFALLTGVVSLAMLVMHGAIYLQMRTEGEWPRGPAARRASSAWSSSRPSSSRGSGRPTGSWATASSPCPTRAASWSRSPRRSKRSPARGWPPTPRTPGCGSRRCSPLAGRSWRCAVGRRPRGAAFVLSAAALAGTILTAGFAMFPFVMPSSTYPNASLTAYDAVSSHRTLNLMFVAVVLFLPVVLLYTSWVYRVLRGKVTEKRIREETHSAY